MLFAAIFAQNCGAESPIPKQLAHVHVDIHT